MEAREPMTDDEFVEYLRRQVDRLEGAGLALQIPYIGTWVGAVNSLIKRRFGPRPCKGVNSNEEGQ